MIVRAFPVEIADVESCRGAILAGSRPGNLIWPTSGSYSFFAPAGLAAGIDFFPPCFLTSAGVQLSVFELAT